MKKSKDPLSYLEKMLALKKAGLLIAPMQRYNYKEVDSVLPLNERIQLILGLQNVTLKSTEMIFFIMYDIENNKVRTLLSRFLIKKGCFRIQKSIFIGKTERVSYAEIFESLRKINELYDNKDSIIMVPVSTDILQNMKLIGENVDIEIITKNPNTMFF